MDIITQLIKNWKEYSNDNPDIAEAIKGGYEVAVYDQATELIMSQELVDGALKVKIIEESHYIGSKGLDMAWDEVRKMHLAFNHPVSDKPVMLDRERAESRVRWTVDEVQREFLEATDVVGQADAVIDGIYFLLGTLVEMGVRPQNLFEIVQNANMAKLFPDGKPRYIKELNNKIMKPEGWEAPEPKLLAEIQRQLGA